MQCKERLQEYLTENGASFQIERHRVAYTAQDLAAAEHISGRQVAKVVVAVADGDVIMLVLPASSHVDLGKLRQSLSAREVRLAKEEEFAVHFSDCEVGAMPPFGNLYGIRVYVDKALSKANEIAFPAGSHTESVRMPYSVYESLVHPAVLDFATKTMVAQL
jgi:Ala-tRNA(Pro) deacylase